MKSRRTPLALGILAPLLLAVAACGGSDADSGNGGGGSATSGGSGGPNLALAAEGKDIAARNGCAGCHGANGEGGVGPAWIGVFGTEVELTDGTRVVADEAYLIDSIKTPDAQKVAGYAVAMPANQLSDDDIAKVVAYIESLAGEAPATTSPLPTAPTIPIATAAPTTAAPGG